MKAEHTYRRLLKATQKYWPLFLIGIVATFALSGIDSLFSYMIKPIVDKGFIHRNIGFIKYLPYLVVVFFALRSAAGFCSTYFITRVSRSVVMDFRQKIFKHLLRLPISFYDNNNSGNILATILYNVDQVADASSQTLIIALRQGALAIGLITVMFSLNWKLTAIFLLVAPVIAFIINLCSKRLRSLSSSVQDAVSDVTQIANEAIDANKAIRIYDGKKYETNKFVDATRRNRHRELKIVVTNSISTSLTQLLLAIPLAVLLWFATVPSQQVSAGSFAAIIAAMLMLTRPLRQLSNLNSMIQKGIAGAASIFKLLDTDLEKDSGNKQIDRVNGEIILQNVSFQYDNSSAQVLDNINLSVPAGKTVALVGHSGSGKTTLVNLLPRFYDLLNDNIFIDGIPIKEMTLDSLRCQFAFVSQLPTLFNDTVANNIAYADPNPDFEKIRLAAESAYAHGFIDDLPKKYGSIIGENGVLLSGGQRQRIAIARALYRDAPILILDEATSALDSHAEKQIQAALENLMANRTTIVIAHRLSTIENADQIVVMNKGRVIEQGTHHDLINNGGLYRDLHQLQFSAETRDCEQAMTS